MARERESCWKRRRHSRRQGKQQPSTTAWWRIDVTTVPMRTAGRWYYCHRYFWWSFLVFLLLLLLLKELLGYWLLVATSTSFDTLPDVSNKLSCYRLNLTVFAAVERSLDCIKRLPPSRNETFSGDGELISPVNSRPKIYKSLGARRFR